MIGLQSIQASVNRPLSASLVAWLLAYFHEEKWWNFQDLNNLIQAVNGACNQFFDLQAGNINVSKVIKKDPRNVSIADIPKHHGSIKIYSDYEPLTTILSTNKFMNFALVENFEEADYIYTTKKIKDFTTIPIHQKVCQFPYEGGLVQKDLLPLTIRKNSYIGLQAPDWWLPCYDLSTEFHLFAKDFHERSLQQQEGAQQWIVKPAQGTRGLGHKIFAAAFSADEKQVLRDIACHAPLITQDQLQAMTAGTTTTPLPKDLSQEDQPRVDKVAQSLVLYPLLVRERKFDIRYFIFVRSFEPFEAYLHVYHYARLANKPYSVTALQDAEVSITVSTYQEDQVIADKQERIWCTELPAALQAQYEQEGWLIDYDGMQRQVVSMCQQLFGQAGRLGIGNWPNSSAYFGIDVIFDMANYQQREQAGTEKRESIIPEPKLIEVNFMGDWHVVEVAAAIGEIKEEKEELYHQWIEDLLLVLVRSKFEEETVIAEELRKNERLIRL